MSLINDALQRAKKVQQSNQPLPGAQLQLRPIEASQHAPKGPGMLAIALAGVFAVGAVFIAAQLLNRRSTPPPKHSSSPAEAEPSPLIQPDAGIVLPTVFTGSLPVLARTNELATEEAAPVTEAAPPKPVPPRLQAIVFSATPSAIINGKTVFLNGQADEFKVTSITRNSVTLSSANGNHVLTLDDD